MPRRGAEEGPPSTGRAPPAKVGRKAITTNGGAREPRRLGPETTQPPDDDEALGAEMRADVVKRPRARVQVQTSGMTLLGTRRSDATVECCHLKPKGAYEPHPANVTNSRGPSYHRGAFFFAPGSEALVGWRSPCLRRSTPARTSAFKLAASILTPTGKSMALDLPLSCALKSLLGSGRNAPSTKLMRTRPF